jgi:hypothetical protein
MYSVRLFFHNCISFSDTPACFVGSHARGFRHSLCCLHRCTLTRFYSIFDTPGRQTIRHPVWREPPQSHNLRVKCRKQLMIAFFATHVPKKSGSTLQTMTRSTCTERGDGAVCSLKRAPALFSVTEQNMRNNAGGDGRQHKISVHHHPVMAMRRCVQTVRVPVVDNVTLVVMTIVLGHGVSGTEIAM